MGRFRPRALGDSAERFAEDYLVKRGLQLVQRNFRCRLGEIDLVMADEQILVIVEVRYRNERSFTPAYLTVDFRKQQKLIRTAAMLLTQLPRWQNRAMRFDVIGVDAAQNNRPQIAWLRDAFRPGDGST